MKTLGEEIHKCDDGAECEQAPDPPAVGPLGGRHETEDEQTHRDPDQSCVDSEEHDTYTGV